MSEEPKESELAERRRKAQARLDELQQAREEREARRREQEQVERLEREARDEEAVARVEDEHGPIDDVELGRIDTDRGVVIVRKPKAIHMQRYRDTGEAKTADLEKLVRVCLVYPDKSAFDSMVEELPALLDRVANKVVILGGFRLKEVSGK